jgi:hypothetical protein
VQEKPYFLGSALVIGRTLGIAGSPRFGVGTQECGRWQIQGLGTETRRPHAGSEMWDRKHTWV